MNKYCMHMSVERVLLDFMFTGSRTFLGPERIYLIEQGF